MNEEVLTITALAQKYARQTQRPVNFAIDIDKDGNLLYSINCVKNGIAVQYVDNAKSMTSRLESLTGASSASEFEFFKHQYT